MRNLPLVDVVQEEYLLLLFVKVDSALKILFFKRGHLGILLPIAVYLVPDIAEEGQEAFLDEVILALDYVPPLNHHIVERYEYTTEVTLRLRRGDLRVKNLQ